MTPYALEFAIMIFAIAGAIWVASEFAARGDWTMVGFFVVFLMAPIWFAVASFRTLAYGEPDWLFNHTISFWMRLPIVVALYIVAWRKRQARNGHGR